jgi:serine O-acetyltransferase
MYRYEGARTTRHCLRAFFREPGACFTVWLRLAAFLKTRPLMYPLFLVASFLKRRYEIKFGFSVPTTTAIGSGLYFSHFGGIVVNECATIGRNCNIGHGVTIGQSNRGKRKGYPTIGDNVFIGPGAKIFGKVRIGSNAAIGANSVVTADVPEKAVVAGIPARIISMEGSFGYIDWTEHEPEGEGRMTCDR